MALSDVIAQIDVEIAKLQQAKELLSGSPDVMVSKPGRGRPKGSKNASTISADASASAAPAKSKRKLSPEGRKAIADAMKRRWAERRTKQAK